MKWPLMWRRNGVNRARYEQVIDQRDEARKEAAHHVCKITELCGDVDRLTASLTAARREVARCKGARTVSDVLVEHDVHRKALAVAIGSTLDRNWDQLIDAAARLREAAAAWKADFEQAKQDQGDDVEALKRRIKQLEKQYDDAVGLTAGRPQDSSKWQPGYQDPKAVTS